LPPSGNRVGLAVGLGGGLGAVVWGIAVAGVASLAVGGLGASLLQAATVAATPNPRNNCIALED
jgi:hypothetical protein